MTDAPERIWAFWWPQGVRAWRSDQMQAPARATEYTRADLTDGMIEAESAKLSDPVAVHANMLRGTVAKPTLAQIAHLYPEVRALVKAATPYVSPVQNADYGRQLREYEALNAALAPFTEGDKE